MPSQGVDVLHNPCLTKFEFVSEGTSFFINELQQIVSLVTNSFAC